MAGQLTDRVVFITGGARGQGRAHAEAFAKEGAHVVLFDRAADSDHIAYPLASVDDLSHTADLVRAQDREALPLTGDVRNEADVRAAVDAALARFGRIDALVANAGVHGGGAVQDADPSVWDEVLAVNLTGVFHTMRAVAPHMIERGYGRIVATASNQGRMAVPGSVAYVASKWGVIGLVKAAALDLAPFGVTVNAVAPGNTSTPMVHNTTLYRALRPDLPDPTWEDVEPLLREHHVQPVTMLEPAEITAAVLFLIGPDTPHITGTVIDVSAGSTAGSSG